MNNHMTKQTIINVSGLAKSFNGINAVSDLSLQITQGTIFGFLGANGSGKTTCLRLLCGLLVPDRGQGKCLDLDLINQTKLIQAKIGYMPQQFCLYRNLTVYENLDFIARIYGVKNPKNRLKEIIDQLNINEKQKQITGTLSVGWQQRIALAAALIHNPSILILDEPTSGIDPQTRLLIWNYIQNIVGQGATVLLSTHYMDEAERCHQLAYMAYGAILVCGSANEIIESTGLHSWRIKGQNLRALKEKLSKHLETIQLIEKGNEIRLSSLQKNAINEIDPALLARYEVHETETTLEDTFIFKIQHEDKVP